MRKVISHMPENTDSVLVTLIDGRGSIPQEIGTKMIVTQTGLYVGTVGGGKLEAKAINLCLEFLKNKTEKICQIVTWNLTRDIGMTCGGEVTLLFEINRVSDWSIVVFGAGHVAQELVPLLTKFNCRITCVDPRIDWLDKIQNFSNLKKIQISEPENYVKECSSKDYFILMTQGHSTDVPVIVEILKQHQPPYIGVIGSKTKALKIRTHLKEMDFSKEKIESFHCPIGLGFGDSSPVEIAVSVAAQLLQERDRLQGFKRGSIN
jgi:xanthine dehydrogenase accessory factor